jgi:signal transduction histidine kinase
MENGRAIEILRVEDSPANVRLTQGAIRMAEPVTRILLVGDSPPDAQLLRAILAEPDVVRYEVTHVQRLTEAVRYLQADRFDITLLDLSLPDSQGMETVRNIRREAPGVPIVVLTGLDDETLGIAAVREGAQDYLVKGQSDRRLLVRAIRYAIERHRAEEALARYRDHLEELVVQRTEALAATNAVLQEQIVERARAEEALDAARHKLETERERQRLSLASELHDSVGQELIGMKFTLERVMATSKAGLTDSALAGMKEAVSQCSDLIREVRAISHGLYPPALRAFGLTQALKHVGGDGQQGIPVVVTTDAALEAARFPNDIEITLYRITQEALLNAQRHSRATRIAIHLGCDGDHAVLTITDDGVGFSPDKVAGRGLGFISMNERVANLGGTFNVRSEPGETRIEVRVPSQACATHE